jgi:hypothetical protein
MLWASRTLIVVLKINHLLGITIEVDIRSTLDLQSALVVHEVGSGVDGSIEPAVVFQIIDVSPVIVSIHQLEIELPVRIVVAQERLASVLRVVDVHLDTVDFPVVSVVDGRADQQLFAVVEVSDKLVDGVVVPPVEFYLSNPLVGRIEFLSALPLDVPVVVDVHLQACPTPLVVI